MRLPQYVFHLEDIPDQLRLHYFEFFYWFSRFEFALKENGYVEKGPNRAAFAAWSKFKREFAAEYQLTKEAQALFENPPLRQVYSPSGYEWEKTDLSREGTNLGKAILIVKTIRNNLFHEWKT